MKFLIIFGGISYEHEISIVSAIALKKVLNCELIYIFCDAHRDFYLIPTDEITSKRFSSGEYKKDKPLFLKQGGFYGYGSVRNNIDPIIAKKKQKEQIANQKTVEKTKDIKKLEKKEDDFEW